MTQEPLISSHRSDRLPIRLPWPITLLAAIEALILLAAGVVLYCLPLWEGLRWPWEITPYNTVFLGGIYWSAFAVVGLQLLRRRWLSARLIQPMVLIFSLVLLLVSLAYPEQFNFQRRLVKAWFLVYTVVPLGAGFGFWHLRRIAALRQRLSLNPNPLPHAYGTALKFKAGGLALYGTALLLLPAFATAFWPWPIDSFHARLYSSVFLTMGFANWCLSRRAAATELVVLGMAELLLGALPLWGIVNLDRVLGKIDWSLPGGWLWFGLLGVWAIAGLDLIRRGIRWQERRKAVAR